MAETVQLGLSGDRWTVNEVTFEYDDTESRLSATASGSTDYGLIEDGAPSLEFIANGATKAATRVSGGAPFTLSADAQSVLDAGAPYAVRVGDTTPVDVTEAIEAVLPSASPADIQAIPDGTQIYGSVSTDVVGDLVTLDPGEVTPGQQAAITAVAQNFGGSRGTATIPVRFNGRQVGAVEYDLEPGEFAGGTVTFTPSESLSGSSVSWGVGDDDYTATVNPLETGPEPEMVIDDLNVGISTDDRRTVVVSVRPATTQPLDSGETLTGTIVVTLDGREQVREQATVESERTSTTVDARLSGVEPGDHEVCASIE